MTSGERLIEVELNFIDLIINDLGLGDYYHFFVFYGTLLARDD